MRVKTKREGDGVFSTDNIFLSEHKVAGHTADYVNRVIDRVYSGDPTGAINDI